MHIRLQHLIFAALVISLVSLAYGINYLYLSNCEQTSFGDRIRFWTPDTLMGRVHSNGTIAIEGSPQFYDQVSSCGHDFWRGPGYNPGFHGPLPIFDADSIHFPNRADNLRECALRTGTFYSMPGRSYRVHLRSDTAYVSRFYTGIPFDSSDSWTLSLFRRCIFFDGPLEIEGHIAGEASIGSSCNILLLDNVVYDDAVVTVEGKGYTPPSSHNYLMLASEADIKIGNTPANGREDSHGRGLSQTNLDSTSIFITAALYALGESLSFEQQNDNDSGYVFQNPPGTPHRDDRGAMYLFGALAQYRRGYLHRSTPAGGTPSASSGYTRWMRWDTRLASWNPPGGFDFDSPHQHNTDTLDFGGVPVGHAVWDTARIYVGTACNLGSVLTTAPFYATRVPPFYASEFAIPVSFTPTRPSQYSAILYVSTPFRYYQIVLRGRGLPGGAPLSVDVAPNPFNLTTTLHYTLSEAGAVKITMYDVLGRMAKVISVGSQESGEHSAQLNAENLASGVYFVKLQTGTQMVTKKILLLK